AKIAIETGNVKSQNQAFCILCNNCCLTPILYLRARKWRMAYATEKLSPATSEKLDRRIRRTRRLLCEAMLALLVEEEYESITVQQITSRADVNRATFYHHF